MEESNSNNQVFLRGSMAGEPRFSHASRSESFYTFPLEVVRLSSVADRINIVIRESQLSGLRPSRAGLLDIRGELRSFNNRSGDGRRLVITVFARDISAPADVGWDNRVALTGTICKLPHLRRTPLGREICDLLIAVNRPYGRSDYLPCIAWGATARRAAEWTVGQRVRLEGRIQSRDYIKNLDGQAVQRTAYEVSVSRASPLPEETAAEPL